MTTEKENPILEEWKPDEKPIPVFEDRVSKFTVLREIAIGVLLRVVFFSFFTNYLQRRPELSTSLTSFYRLREAVHLKRNGFDPYQGDLFHMQPVFLAAFDVVMDYAKALSALFIGFDVLTSLLLRRCARMYMKKEKLSVASEYVSDFPHLVFRCYLFNPLTVASCAVFNITVVSNFFVAIFLFSLLSQCGFLNGCITGLLIHQNLHFLPLIFVQALGNKVFSSNLKLLKGLLFTAASFAGWNALSVYLHGSAKFLPNTYGFSLLFPDLTPNVGIFWYHFCEVFEHFRSFFTWAFQLNYVVYVLPLALTLRKNPIIYFIVTLVLMSTFAPYPSLADTCVYLAILPMISDLTKYIRYTLIIGCTYVSCLILAPIMWKMWIITGSGNANFYFAVTLIFDVAQIFLATDLIYAFIRRDLRNFAPKGIDIDKAAAGFACI